MQWHDFDLKTGIQDLAEEENGRSQWEPYVSHLRENIDCRKRSVELVTTWIARNPGGPRCYAEFGRVCQGVVELQEDSSQWEKGWGPLDTGEQAAK